MIRGGETSQHRYHIIAISMVKNEMDVIESFVRHTLSFADELIICDHQSSDQTRQILEQLQAEGLPLTIETELRPAHLQSEVMTRLLQEAAVRGADFVLPLDADEFLLPRDPGVSVRALLEGLDSSKVYQLHWRLYAPQVPERVGTSFLLAAPVLRSSTIDVTPKVIVGTHVPYITAVSLAEGNHYAYVGPSEWSRQIDEEKLTALELGHFYYRSPQQFLSKVAVGWANIAAKYSIATYNGGGYRRYCQRVLEGEAFTPEEFVPQGEVFDLRPYAPPQTLRYSSAATPDPLRNLMRASDLLAEQVAELDAAARQVLVTSVVPFFGDLEELRRDLAQEAAQTYPHLELLVPCFVPCDESMRQVMRAACYEMVEKGRTCHVIWPEEAVFDRLAALARGAYVHWHLPWIDVAPNFVARLMACMVHQECPAGMLLSGGGRPYRDEAPYLVLPQTLPEDCYRRKTLWKVLLVNGQYPVGGITALLIERAVLDDCGWLRAAFSLANGKVYPFHAWRLLLLAAGLPLIGSLEDSYVTPVREGFPIQALVAHQLEWISLLQLEREAMAADEWEEACLRVRRRGASLLAIARQGGVDFQQPLWQKYQELLQSFQ